MNFTNEGNNSHIRWAIIPAESADCFSNTTAMVLLDYNWSLRFIKYNVKPNS